MREVSPSCGVALDGCLEETPRKANHLRNIAKAVTSAVTRATNSKFSGARALLSLKSSYGGIETKAVTISQLPEAPPLGGCSKRTTNWPPSTTTPTTTTNIVV